MNLMGIFSNFTRKQLYIAGSVIAGLVIILIVTSLLLILSKPVPKESTFIGTKETGSHTLLQLHLADLVPPENTKIPSMVDININTNGDRAVGTQFILQYDPSFMSNVKLNPIYPTGFFPKAKIIANYVDSTNGKINFAELIPDGGSPVIGKGEVATITFNLTNKIHTRSTTIKFVDTADVLGTKTGESVLKEVQNVTIPKL